MAETPTRRDVPFSWFGFLSLSLGIGALQMMLDRGAGARLVRTRPRSSSRRSSRSSASISFFADCFTSKRPFISLRIFRDWNFSIALVFMFLIGIILLATMALVTPFIQNMLGYPVLSSGYLLGARGIGTFVAMFLVGRLSGKVDPRILIFIGLVLATASLWLMVGWSLDVSAQTIAINSVAQGFGLGFVFVPLNTIAFASLPGELRTEGAALWTLIRNLGSSVGISIVIAQLTSMISEYHSQLVEHVTPFSDALHMPSAGILSGMGLPNLEMLEQMVTQQAAAMAYSNDFLLMTLVSLCRLPAARADPLAQGRAGAVPRSGGACGDGLSAASEVSPSRRDASPSLPVRQSQDRERGRQEHGEGRAQARNGRDGAEDRRTDQIGRIGQSGGHGDSERGRGRRGGARAEDGGHHVGEAESDDAESGDDGRRRGKSDGETDSREDGERAEGDDPRPAETMHDAVAESAAEKHHQRVARESGRRGAVASCRRRR